VPIKRSSAKDVRRTLRRRTRNITVITRLRSSLKLVREAKTPADAKKAYAAAEKLLDKAGRKRYIHPKTAARQKSRLSKVVAAKH